MVGKGGEDAHGMPLVVQVISVELADETEALVELVLLAPSALVVLLAALDGLVAVDVALVGEGDGHFHTWLHLLQLEVHRPAAFGGNDVFVDLYRNDGN